MKLDLKHLHLLMECPLKYNLVVNHGLEEPLTLKGEFSKAIHRTIYHYYFRLMENVLIGEAQLQAVWERAWFGNVTPEDIITKVTRGDSNQASLPESRDYVKKYGYEGLAQLLNFYRGQGTKPGFVIDVEREFLLPVEGHLISGTIEVVKEVRDLSRKTARMIEMVDFRTTDKHLDDWEVYNDLYLTAQVMAYRHVYEQKEQKVCYHYLANNEKVYTERTERHAKRFRSTIKALGAMVDGKQFYPRPGYYCKPCHCKDFCSEWGV